MKYLYIISIVSLLSYKSYSQKSLCFIALFNYEHSFEESFNKLKKDSSVDITVDSTYYKKINLNFSNTDSLSILYIDNKFSSILYSYADSNFNKLIINLLSKSYKLKKKKKHHTTHYPDDNISICTYYFKSKKYNISITKSSYHNESRNEYGLQIANKKNIITY